MALTGRTEHASRAAPSELECIVTLNSGLTAGPTHCRLFEAGPEVVGSLVHRSNRKRNEARSAGRKQPRVSAWLETTNRIEA
jgi:hypothetical protein